MKKALTITESGKGVEFTTPEGYDPMNNRDALEFLAFATSMLIILIAGASTEKENK